MQDPSIHVPGLDPPHTDVDTSMPSSAYAGSSLALGMSVDGVLTAHEDELAKTQDFTGKMKYKG